MPIDRRAFLGALAVGPAALAGCAGAATPPGSAARGGDPAAAPGRGRAPAGPAAEAIRAFPLSADAEPALVFRAAAARPGER